MTTLLTVLLIANLCVLAFLAFRHQQLRAQVGELQRRSQSLGGDPAERIPDDLLRVAREGASMLSVRILNPMELAAQKHWAAGLAGRITPGLVRRIVSMEAAKILRQELPKYGVVAEVEVVPGSGA